MIILENNGKFCTILTESDLQSNNLKNTVKTIEHNPNKFYLLSTGLQKELQKEKKSLCNVIEDLTKVSDDENLFTKIRMAYDLDFTLQTSLKIGNDANSDDIKEIKTFAELLELLDFNENLVLNREDYHVIINDDGHDKDEAPSQAVSKLFQQFIFLNINFDIKKKSEIKQSLIKDRFRSKYPELLGQVEDNKKYLESALEHAKLTDDSKNRVKNMLTSFGIMLEEFAKAKSRPLRIAAMGTKKAGKSVVINSLLKRDYAPTSLTLPTPNTIKYVPSDPNQPITLEYNGQKYAFNSPEAISDFIGEEFKKAQRITGEGAGLPDMTIYYPCDDLSGYEVWDTPGPNVAFTEEHRKNAEECIKHVDVCIFVMNYSNHLTNDEVSFLKKIRNAFQENNKFYSLFITVNRIDERYNDKEEKAVNRILDYISGRLDALDYHNIVLFGTSALQSFYLTEILKTIKADESDSDEVIIDSDSIRPLKRKYKNLLTPLNFIGKALDNLYDFHGIDNPTEKELAAFSGVPQLWSYVQYIGEQKADMEIVNSVVGNCEAQFVNIKNAWIVTDLLNLTEKDKEYLKELVKLIDELKRDVERAVNAINPLIDENKLKSAYYDIAELEKSLRQESHKTALDRCNSLLNGSNLTQDDVKKNAQGVQSDNIIQLNSNVSKIVFGTNKRSAEQFDMLKNDVCQNYSKVVEAGIQKAQARILKRVDEVKSKVTNTTAKNVLESFQFPKFPSSIGNLMSTVTSMEANISKSTLSQIARDVKRIEYETKYETETRTKYRTETRQREAQGIWENIRSFFGKDYYEDVTVSYEEEFQVPYQVEKEVYDVKSFKDKMAHEIQSRIFHVIDSAHDKMEQAIKSEIKGIFDNVNTQCNNIRNGYIELFGNLKNDINMASDKTNAHRQALEQDIKTLNDIEKHLQPFFNTWNNILHNDVKR